MPAIGPFSKPEELGPERADQVRHHLADVLTSPAFAGSKRTQDFLQLIVEHALAGRVDMLRERMIGAEMFGRRIDYDTANDAVVRVKASEVRKKLMQYYLSLPTSPTVRITLPSGSYVPVIYLESQTLDASASPIAPSQGVAGESQEGSSRDPQLWANR